jgi:anti-sigma regulatory factor (Ser/Thr protein kinase)
MIDLDFKNIDLFCRSIDLDVDKPVIDLSEVELIKPIALVYLGLFIRWQNQNGIHFHMILPSNPKVRSYLDKQNFYDRFNIAAPNNNVVNFDPDKYSFELVDISKESDVADLTANKIANLLHRLKVKVRIDEFCEAVVELVDNFAVHSEEQAGIMMIQYHPKKKEICFIIGDCGIGIRASLSKNLNYYSLKEKPHLEAIIEAVKLGSSRFEGRGMGFNVAVENVTKRGGTLLLISFGSYIRITDHKFNSGIMRYELPGVQVEFSFREDQ